MKTLGMITIVIDEYDRAIKHYVKELGFALIEDTELTPETYQSYLACGIEFTETPRNEKFGQVVVFKDMSGNKWDLIFLSSPA